MSSPTAQSCMHMDYLLLLFWGFFTLIWQQIESHIKWFMSLGRNKICCRKAPLPSALGENTWKGPIENKSVKTLTTTSSVNVFLIKGGRYCERRI